jgi:hypothetical protein
MRQLVTPVIGLLKGEVDHNLQTTERETPSESLGRVQKVRVHHYLIDYLHLKWYLNVIFIYLLFYQVS